MKQELGRQYADGDAIISEGETGDCMYVVQSGRVTVVKAREGKEIVLGELGPGDFFGEMALFAPEVRSATVRASGEATVLTVDKRTLLGRIQKDPTLAFRMLEHLASRLREIDHRFARIRAADRRNWENRPEDQASV